VKTPLVIIGASLGGPAAIRAVLAGLPAGFPWAIIVVQHWTAGNDELLSETLAQGCSLQISTIIDKDPIQPGRVQVAPPGYHLLVEDDHFALSLDPPLNHSRPSIDLCFESAAEAFGTALTGIILTGANEDGARGLARIKALGGRALVQDPAEAECAVMPKAALAAVVPDAVLPLAELSAWLTRSAAVKFELSS
jgi:two-component system chemotaxis response regulator CheB